MSVTPACANPTEVKTSRAAASNAVRVAAPRSEIRTAVCACVMRGRSAPVGRATVGPRPGHCGATPGQVSAAQTTPGNRRNRIASAANSKGVDAMSGDDWHLGEEGTGADLVTGGAATTSMPGQPAEQGAQQPDPGQPERHAPDRNLALELARVTEAAAMAAARWVGRGDKNGADAAAVNAMRQLINSVSMNGVVVIGEGEKDKAPMLFNGEQVGDGTGPLCDVAVDPIDGTRLTANGMANAISVITVSARDSMYDPSAVFYMSKLVTGPAAASAVDIEAPVSHNVAAVSKEKGCSPPATSRERLWRRGTARAWISCLASAARRKESSRHARSNASAA